MKLFSIIKKLLKSKTPPTSIFFFPPICKLPLISLKANKSAVLCQTVEPGIDGAVYRPRYGDDVARGRPDHPGHDPGPAAQAVGADVIVETFRSFLFTDLMKPFFNKQFLW